MSLATRVLLGTSAGRVFLGVLLALTLWTGGAAFIQRFYWSGLFIEPIALTYERDDEGRWWTTFSRQVKRGSVRAMWIENIVLPRTATSQDEFLPRETCPDTSGTTDLALYERPVGDRARALGWPFSGIHRIETERWLTQADLVPCLDKAEAQGREIFVSAWWSVEIGGQFLRPVSLEFATSLEGQN